MLNLLKNQMALLFSGKGWRHSPDEMIITLNHKNRILKLSKHAPSILGVSRKSLKGQSFFRLIAGENQDGFAEIVNYLRREKAAQSDKASLITKKMCLTLIPKNNPKVRCLVSMQMGSFDTIKLLITNVMVEDNTTPAMLEQSKNTALGDMPPPNQNIPHDEGINGQGINGESMNVGASQGPTVNLSPAPQENCFEADRLADLSHEMKTPLNAILGFSDTMRQETFGPIENKKYKEYLEYIHSSGTHLMNLVTSVLDIAKIDANRYKLEPVSSNIADLARECVAMLKLQAKDAGLKIILDTDKEIGPSLLDPRVVNQILINLLSNAVKFTSDGEIRVSTSLEGETLKVIVRDTGMGMNKEQLEKLGTRFTTAQGDGVRGTKGNGLGLSLASSLAQTHGGTLAFESAPGEGLTAILSLPLVPLLSRNNANINHNAVGDTNPHAEWAGTHIVGNSPQPIPQGKIYVGGKPPALQTQMERIEKFRKKVGKKQGANAA